MRLTYAKFPKLLLHTFVGGAVNYGEQRSFMIIFAEVILEN